MQCYCGSPEVVATIGQARFCRVCLDNRWPGWERHIPADSAVLNEHKPDTGVIISVGNSEWAGAAGPRPEPIPDFETTPEMAQVFDKLGKSNLFITGRAGTGKSTLLKQYHATASGQIAVVAPTGVAALNAGGATIHSFFKFRWGITLDDVANTYPRDPALYRNLECLVIDEVSMVRADVLDCVDAFLRKHGPEPGRPFGGVAVGLVGDPYQLPPVVTSSESMAMRGYSTPHFFSANAYREGGFETVNLLKPFRQRDTEFLRSLDVLRDGTATLDDLAVFGGRVRPDVSAAHLRDADSTLLTTHNDQAACMNQSILDSLPGPATAFQATVEGYFPPSRFPTVPRLHLKPGARVMLLINNMPTWVNGTVAVVDAIEDLGVSVKLPNGSIAYVEEHTWDQVEYQTHGGRLIRVPVGTFRQLPLRLAWAVTIHKAQGLTLDRGIVDLGRGVFAAGQLYVAVSRFRELEGLTLTPRPIQAADIRVDRAVHAFMQNGHQS